MVNPSLIPAAWREHDLKVKPYVLRNRVLSWSEKVMGVGLFLVLLSQGFFEGLEGYWASVIGNAYLVWLAFFGILAVGWEILTLPFSILAQAVEKQYQLSKQSWGAWAWDRVKGYLVGGVLGALVLFAVFFSFTVYTVDAWWVLALFLVLFSVLLAQLAPVLLIPIFLELKPMEDGPLKKRLLGLCEQFKIRVKDVYHLGMGAKTEKGNAAFMGLGATKRIVIGDTLYNKFSPEQVEAVFAHEVGHQVHHDLWKGLALSTAMMFLSFWVTQLILLNGVYAYYGVDFSRPVGAMLFFVVLSIVQTPVSVLQAAFSRWRERMADEFANQHGMSLELASALERLTEQNFGLFIPNAFREWWGFSHPAPWRRILKLRKTIE